MFLRSHSRAKDGKDHQYWSLVETVRTPEGSSEEIKMEMAPIPGQSIENILKPGHIFSINSSAPPDFATVFGKTFDVGPYSIAVQPSKVETITESDKEGFRTFRISLAGPLIYQCEKFLPPPLDPAST